MNPKSIVTVEQISGFLNLIGQTREHEIDCGERLVHVAEFAKREVKGRPHDDALDSVEHHLSVCPGYRERFEALRNLLLSDTRGGEP